MAHGGAFPAGGRCPSPEVSVVFDLELWYNVKKRRREESSVEWLVMIGIPVFLLYFLVRSAVKGGVLDAWAEIERIKHNRRGDE